MTTDKKQRVTLFVDPSLVRQARAQALVEESTLTELVEKSLHCYLPKEVIIRKQEPEVDSDK
jgi:hypothetical protein